MQQWKEMLWQVHCRFWHGPGFWFCCIDFEMVETILPERLQLFAAAAMIIKLTSGNIDPRQISHA